MAVIGFIPVRGDSKSIPLKNIKPFCHRPLLYWTARALAYSELVDEVIVATDSAHIVEATRQLSLPKLRIFNRSAKNAQDHSSTESVMLEYIKHDKLHPQDTFILAQATSPFTTTEDIDRGLNHYNSPKNDSILSAVMVKHFYWSHEGKSLNYDFKNRPRRQDFEGLFQENGAFYINSVANITKYENRLSGKIGFSPMPAYSTYEIDEPDDWYIAELLMKKYGLNES